MQEWVKASGAKICVVFEGRDSAGKGGSIKAITERVSPRVFRIVALPSPTEREKSQMYIQRYIPHLPAAGEVVIFDRSWYNRAGVERVMGFCTDEQAERFLEMVPAVEQAMVDSGIVLVEVLARGRRTRADQTAEGARRRPAQDLEAVRHGPQVVPPVVRLRPSPRRHVRRHRHRLGAVACRAHRRQAPRTAEPHHTPPQPGALRARSPRRRSRSPNASPPATTSSPTSPRARSRPRSENPRPHVPRQGRARIGSSRALRVSMRSGKSGFMTLSGSMGNRQGCSATCPVSSP